MADKDSARVNMYVERQLDELAAKLEEKLQADVMAIVGPIHEDAAEPVRQAIENRTTRRPKLAVILDTVGGLVEIVERMVNTIRHHYQEVIFIIPNRAMSAGTVFVMSGDRIMMDYFSCLGPIDPQLEKGDRMVPVLSYLVQYERLKERSDNGEMTPAEAILLQNLDLAELHSYEEAKALSDSLLKEWLANYKFKNWKVTEGQQTPVTQEMREARALEIANKLADHQKWHSHARYISMDVLRNDLKLKVEDFGEDAELSKQIKEYHQFLDDYMGKIGAFHFVHAKQAYLPILWRPT